METPLFVSPMWLKSQLAHDDVIPLYTRMANIKTGEIEALDYKVIDGAQLFDFENEFHDKYKGLPHTMPCEADFQSALQKIGINNYHHLVIYENGNLLVAARVWWMLKSMGHDKISILNGGISAWLSAGYVASDKFNKVSQRGDFQCHLRSNMWITADEICGLLRSEDDFTIIDARSYGRFKGLEPEPREGLRSGHIPASISVPYTDVIADGTLISASELRSIFESKGIPSNSRLIFTCGSGVTACIVAIAAYQAGYKRLSVYDGSWTEWGGDERFPIAT